MCACVGGGVRIPPIDYGIVRRWMRFPTSPENVIIVYLHGGGVVNFVDLYICILIMLVILINYPGEFLIERI